MLLAIDEARHVGQVLLVLVVGVEKVLAVVPRKVDIRLPGKGNSDSHGARPFYYNHLDD